VSNPFPFFLIVLSGITLLTCTQRTVVEPESFIAEQYAYFPMRIGQFKAYQTDSIVFDFSPDGSTRLDSTRTYVKELVTDTFRDNSGTLTYTIQWFERKNEQAPWIIKQTNAAIRTSSQAIYSESNLRFLKLVFPLDMRTEWNGNLWIDQNREIEIAGERLRPFSNWGYEVDSFDVPAVVGQFAFDSTLLITEADDQNILERRFSKVRYAKNIGLVWREQWILDTQYCNQIPFPADCETLPWDQKAEKGYILRQTLISFN